MNEHEKESVIPFEQNIQSGEDQGEEIKNIEDWYVPW